MKQYLIKMRNPKSGKIETYTTQLESSKVLVQALDLFIDGAGYDLISCEEKRDD